MEPTPPALEGKVLTTGLPEKSQGQSFKFYLCIRQLASGKMKEHGIWREGEQFAIPDLSLVNFGIYARDLISLSQFPHL